MCSKCFNTNNNTFFLDSSNSIVAVEIVVLIDVIDLTHPSNSRLKFGIYSSAGLHTIYTHVQIYTTVVCKHISPGKRQMAPFVNERNVKQLLSCKP